ncbi:MAG: UDP-N-acetylmuramoyl-L-alanine--D-glutamate ligase [Proteobacteria bacterium]|jgi:UDP-N-acetylmuramoylalanine--D-glutamate ligase|nr:UDP-N-acetylmuramoyl-L-alanine--D-glutamate ligase [Pseudomonadota bacterium]
MKFKRQFDKSDVMSVQELGFRKPFGIVGFGVTGRALLKLFLKLGYQRSDIITFDDKDLEADERNSDSFLEKKPKTLFVSPGVPLKTPWIQAFKAHGGRISSELEFSFAALQAERVVGITGSLGKSTTVSLLNEGAKSIDPHAFAGGNLGEPLASYCLHVMEGRPRAQFIILELSSYQLENFNNLDIEVAGITYLSPNHLERYSSLENYYKTKLFLPKRAQKAIVLNKNGGDLERFFTDHFSGTTPVFWTDRHDSLMQQLQVTHCELVGAHNLDNLALGVRIAQVLNWDARAITAMQKYKGLPHRLENLGNLNGVTFVNDSKATALESVEQAIQSVRSQHQGRIHLLLGGKDKGLHWEKLRPLNQDAQLDCTYFGEFGETIRDRIARPGRYFPKLGLALLDLEKRICPGDLVLLSPGGTSLDEFKSFEDRGHFFKTWVSSLEKLSKKS